MSIKRRLEKTAAKYEVVGFKWVKYGTGRDLLVKIKLPNYKFKKENVKTTGDIFDNDEMREIADIKAKEIVDEIKENPILFYNITGEDEFDYYLNGEGQKIYNDKESFNKWKEKNGIKSNYDNMFDFITNNHANCKYIKDFFNYDTIYNEEKRVFLDFSLEVCFDIPKDECSVCIVE
jgi:hypothetical protein